MTKRIISMLSVAFFALSFVIASSVWLAIFPEYSDSPLEWMAPGLRLSFRASTSVMKPGEVYRIPVVQVWVSIKWIWWQWSRDH